MVFDAQSNIALSSDTSNIPKDGNGNCVCNYFGVRVTVEAGHPVHLL